MIANNRKYHVMHIVDSLEVGGMENGVVNLANNINKELFTFSICCLSHPGTLSKRIKDENIEVISLSWRGGFSPSLFFKLARVFREQKVDIIHTHGWLTLVYSVVASRIARTPVLINGEHGIFYLDKLRRKIAYKFISLLVDRYIVVSYSLENELANILNIGKDKIITIPNGVDLIKFSTLRHEEVAALRLELGIPASSLVIGTLGRLEPQKNVEMLIRVFANICRDDENLHCVLIGDGYLRENLENLTLQLGVSSKVHFVGRVDNPHQMISMLDLFVSASFLEGMSNAILEAMACGKPIVATTVGDNDKLIEMDGNGFLVPFEQSQSLEKAIIIAMECRKPIATNDVSDNVQHGAMMLKGFSETARQSLELEKAIKNLLSNREMRQRFGERSRLIVEEKYDIQKMILRYQEIYLQIIAKKRSAYDL